MLNDPSLHPDLDRVFGLQGRVAVITGAGSGIGRETAQVLAMAGATVVISDINQKSLIETKLLLDQGNASVVMQSADVSRHGEVELLADLALERCGHVDVWVNCAGIIVDVPIMAATEEQLDRVIAVNLKGVFAGCAAAGRVMQNAGSGSIINMSSGGGESAVPGLAIYSMTKAGVNMLTRTAAKELGRYGIRVNAVAPGWVDTPLGNHGFRGADGQVDPKKRTAGLHMREQISPLGITGTPRDIALAILFLASDASRFMTGQILRPNGGVAMP